MPFGVILAYDEPPQSDCRTASGVAFIRCKRGIAHHHLNAIKWHIQFFGHDLGQRRFDPCAQLDFAAEDGDRTIGLDSDPIVHLIGLSKHAALSPLRPFTAAHGIMLLRWSAAWPSV